MGRFAWVARGVVGLGVLALFAGCPDETTSGGDAGGAADVAGVDTGGGGGGCKSDSECTAEGPCKVGSCNLATGQCQEANRPNGTDCSADPCQVAVCEGGVCGASSVKPPDCGGLVCGDDACGNSCGTCTGADETCVSGQCVVGDPCGGVTYDGCCTADGRAQWCDEGELFDTDCGGLSSPSHWCGWTGGLGYWCTDEVVADAGIPLMCPGEACADSCADKECGWVCGEACGSCAEGSWCDSANTCQSCADNQCGGGCGECGAGEACELGWCVPDPCAGSEDFVQAGCCAGDLNVFCSTDGLATIICAAQGCGWDADNQWYDCGFAGPDPSGANPLDCTEAAAAGPPDPGPEVVEEPPVDAGSADAGSAEGVAEPIADAGATDTGAADAGAAEVIEDAGPQDTGAPDTAAPDTAAPDTGTSDTGSDAPDADTP